MNAPQKRRETPDSTVIPGASNSMRRYIQSNGSIGLEGQTLVLNILLGSVLVSRL